MKEAVKLIKGRITRLESDQIRYHIMVGLLAGGFVILLIRTYTTDNYYLGLQVICQKSLLYVYFFHMLLFQVNHHLAYQQMKICKTDNIAGIKLHSPYLFPMSIIRIFKGEQPHPRQTKPPVVNHLEGKQSTQGGYRLFIVVSTGNDLMLARRYNNDRPFWTISLLIIRCHTISLRDSSEKPSLG